ncbi:uncharacterized protein LOC133183066 [Saccostrea echinata]|uniref:uncharacterized protein LOC133183066 n=1 Tax=Saccostrea echinata TaxID=191078 RepID=UPI002A808FB6|nr:uncharacterized protein LOC133183066 [Saccostrea echinata]
MTMKLNPEYVGVKRKYVDELEGRPVKRISPFHNTPKERKEERRKILKMSIQKLRQMEDPEYFLTRSVLINNTLKKLQQEIREEKKYQGYKNCIYKLRPSYGYDVLNNSYLASPDSVFEDPFSLPDDSDKMITDQLTQRLVNEGREDQTDSPRVDPVENGVDCVIPDTSPFCENNETLSDVDTLPVSSSVHKSCSERQICSDMDVLNNLIHALEET